MMKLSTNDSFKEPKDIEAELTRERSDDSSVNSLASDESSNETNGTSFGGTGLKDSTTSQGNSASSSSPLVIAKEESNKIFYLRLLVLLVIFLATVGVSLGVYFLTAGSQTDEFESQFEGASSKILTSFEQIVDQKLNAIASLAVQASLYAAGQPNETWPFITMKDFPLRGAVARELSGALFTRLVPVVVWQERENWEKYSVENTWWLQQAREYNEEKGLGFTRHLEEGTNFGSANRGVDFSSGIGDKIYEFDETFTPAAVQGGGPFFPLWQESPTFGRDITNFDTNAYPDYAPYMLKAYETGEMSIGGLDTAPPGNISHPDLSTSYFSFLESLNAGEVVTYTGDPMSSVFLPVFDDFNAKDRSVVAIIFAVFKWAYYFRDLLPTNFPGLVLVLENNCEGAFTYMVAGQDVAYLGQGDLHQDFSGRADLVRSVDFGSLNAIGEESALGIKLNQDLCAYKLSVYPSMEMEDEYLTWLPLVVTLCVVTVFIFTAIIFLIFNGYVEARQTIVLDQAVKSTAIVTSLFPETVRDRLMGGEYASGKTRLKSFMNGNEDDAKGQPIADLFPYCTVFFADIAGFTAWSSTRDPAHVFILLETIYQAFDIIAKRRGVFKVETIGDSYVAVTGLPNPNEKHALVMTRFATSCLAKFRELTKKLENTLGPDTFDLGLRVGLHSGPVTAGVLRGDRARFQLFGDTVNTAARMESSGKSNRIQISRATADLLVKGGKESWVRRRSDLVNVKGKGILESFWVEINASSESGSVTGSNSVGSGQPTPSRGISSLSKIDTMKQDRLVKWMTDLFVRRMQDIVARQDPEKVGKCNPADLVYRVPEGATSLEEVAEVIQLPEFDAKAEARSKGRDAVKIPTDVVNQLHDVVQKLAEMYQANSFHCFEHAAHVTMSVDKFMSRIVTPDVDESLENGKDSHGIAAHVHNYTHGINSDPLTLLAIIFSALIHDTDHRGVSNMQLAKEDEQMATLYHNKSIAEQHSLDLAWDLLMRDEYAQLRAALFVDRSEMMRFRQVVVNVVLATDIFDKELNDLRKSRWNRAFSGVQDEMHNDLRATIVIEHIIQASDVSHTMQHWHIYRKWNQRLFTEMYTAFKQDRMGKSPADFWYKGELGFFDNYIIPLAKKLKECGVFGVSSDECLNYAMQNRQEWEDRGKEITAEMLQQLEALEVADAPAPEVFKDEQEYENQLDC